jgi:hypothetical protein
MGQGEDPAPVDADQPDRRAEAHLYNHIRIVGASPRMTNDGAAPLVTPQRKIDRLVANGDDDRQEGNYA